MKPPIKKRPFLKKISARYIKHVLYNQCTQNKYIANKFNIYNQTISYNNIAGSIIGNIKSGNQDVFIAKELKNITFHEKTGNSLSKQDNILKIIYYSDGITTQNYIKPFIAKKNIITTDKLAINLLGIHKGYRHFFHIFFDYIIPLFFYLTQYYQNQEILIFIREKTSTVQEHLYNALSSHFANIKFVKIKQNTVVKCKKCLYISYIHDLFYDTKINPQIKQVFSLFRNNLIQHYQINKTQDQHNIYISRSKTRLRRLINETNLKKELVKRNFKIIQAEELSFLQQINLFANAQIVVGVHGAGFTNMIFSPDNSMMLELFPQYYGSVDFMRLSKIRNINRTQIRANNEFIWQWFFLDTKTIINKIDHLLSFKQK